jgi:hypothetical protein
MGAAVRLGIPDFSACPSFSVWSGMPRKNDGRSSQERAACFEQLLAFSEIDNIGVVEAHRRLICILRSGREWDPELDCIHNGS